jgi:putative transposase
MNKATPSRTRHSREQWQAWINEQKASGLSEAAFCEQKDINRKRFSHWKRQLRQRAAPAVAASTCQDAWIELPLSSTPPTGWEIELDLGHGLCLRLRHR